MRTSSGEEEDSKAAELWDLGQFESLARHFVAVISGLLETAVPGPTGHCRSPSNPTTKEENWDVIAFSLFWLESSG